MDILENIAKQVDKENIVEQEKSHCNTYTVLEYFRCRSNGRFTDVYQCENGKYFECIHFHDGKFFEFFSLFLLRSNGHSFQSILGSSSNSYGVLLSRSCPVSLRFNVEADRCDYPLSVVCPSI